MKKKNFLLVLFLMSALWAGAVLSFGAILPFDWGRAAVAIYAICVMTVSFVQWYSKRTCDERRERLSNEGSLRIMDIALSEGCLFLMAFLPRPWTLSNCIVIIVVGGMWLAFLREDIKYEWKNRKSSPCS